MFRRTAILCGILLLCLSGVAFARYIKWKPEERPPVSLKEAVTLADAAAAKREEKYHCISATLAKSFTGGDWELTYSTPGGKTLWISVGSDKSVRESERGFAYY